MRAGDALIWRHDLGGGLVEHIPCTVLRVGATGVLITYHDISGKRVTRTVHPDTLEERR